MAEAHGLFCSIQSFSFVTADTLFVPLFFGRRENYGWIDSVEENYQKLSLIVSQGGNFFTQVRFDGWLVGYGMRLGPEKTLLTRKINAWIIFHYFFFFSQFNFNREEAFFISGGVYGRI